MDEKEFLLAMSAVGFDPEAGQAASMWHGNRDAQGALRTFLASEYGLPGAGLFEVLGVSASFWRSFWEGQASIPANSGIHFFNRV